MVEVDDIERPTDGRVARRQRNIDAVVDIVLEMFGEEAMFPTIEQVSKRSGLSLRSIYRYFADPGELMEAAVVRSRELGVDAAHLHGIGRGPLDRRIDDFVETRMRTYDRIGHAYRATVLNAARHERLLNELSRTRDDLRAQLETQFAPELKAMKRGERAAVVAAADALTQLDSIDLLRRHRELTPAEVGRALRAGLDAMLGG